MGWDGSHMNAITLIAPFNLTRSGLYYYAYGVIRYQGTNGYFWDGQAYSETNARNLAFYSILLYPQVTNGKGYGFSIRCLVR